MTTTTEKKVPSWLKLSDEGVTVTLRYPTYREGFRDVWMRDKAALTALAASV